MVTHLLEKEEFPADPKEAIAAPIQGPEGNSFNLIPRLLSD